MIFPPDKIGITNSPIHGLGVFARTAIAKGEVIEECPVLFLPDDIPLDTLHTIIDFMPPDTPGRDDAKLMIRGHSQVLTQYRFNWPAGPRGPGSRLVVALGYGSLYNHAEDANAGWDSAEADPTVPKPRRLVFTALRDIRTDEEVTIWYGGDEYWKRDGRASVEVKP